MDKSVIPNGLFCYGVRVNQKYINTPYIEDIPYFNYYDKVICPYWSNIGNGLIQCKFLNKSTLNLEKSDSENILLKFLNGDKSKISEFDNGYLFWDKVKECSINIDGETIGDFELISDEKLEKINKLGE